MTSDRDHERFDVVVVPFPFTDRDAEKRRPALVLSSAREFNLKVGHCVLAMITSEESPPWPLDVPLKTLDAAGLSSPSKVRMKIFTLDVRLILRKLGTLSSHDRKAVTSSLKKLGLAR